MDGKVQSEHNLGKGIVLGFYKHRIVTTSFKEKIRKNENGVEFLSTKTFPQKGERGFERGLTGGKPKCLH